MKKRIFIFLIIIIVGGAVMTAFFCRKNRYKDLCVYTEKLLEIKWNDCIETATGDVKRKIGEEEHAYIKLEVKVGCEEDVLNIVRNSFGEPFDLSWVIVPDYQGHEFAAEIKNGDLQYVFEIFMEGKRAKTRSIDVYVVYDENNRMYVYIMG